MISLEKFFDDNFTEGRRYDIINRFAGSCAVFGIDIEDCIEFYKKYSNRDDENREKLIRRTYEKYNNGVMVLTLKEYGVDVLGYFKPNLIKKQKDDSNLRINRIYTLIDKPKNNEIINLSDISTSIKEDMEEFKYLLKRGINKNNIFKYARAGINKLKDRVVFPIYDLKGNCVCYSARSINNSTPRYLFPKVNRMNVIWNIDKVDFNKPVILTEGIIDGIIAMQNLNIQSVSTLSKLITKNQYIILSNFKKVYVMFDGDVDDNYLLNVKDNIETEVEIIKLPKNKDVASLTKYELECIFNLHKIKHQKGGFNEFGIFNR